MLETKHTEGDIEGIVVSELQELLQQKTDKQITCKASDLLHEDLGLTSLELAELVTTLELELDVDPFAEDVSVTSIRTVSDLKTAYVDSLLNAGKNNNSGELDAELAEIQRRAQSRTH